jgi:hypothetical protein
MRKFNFVQRTYATQFPPEFRLTDNTRLQTGWPDDWELGQGWELKKNSCEYCPEGSNKCGTHHQSPIDLERNRAIVGDPMENTCIDIHWMKYEDSTCTWNDLDSKQAFSIERHALKITQPLDYGNGGSEDIRLDCDAGGDLGRRFGRIDFSKGFSDWWFLSHIDFKVPSEHTQEGKRYSAEVQMAHFYSLSGADAGVDNEMATVAVFLQAYDDSPPYPHLDRLICEWRKAEDRTREECGLPSVAHYPGCYNVARGNTPFPSEGESSPPLTVAPTVGAPTEPTVPPVAIPGAPTPPPVEPTAAPVPPPTMVPVEATLTPSSKPPPTPFPTVPTTPDPASAITIAPIGAPALSIQGTDAPVAATGTGAPSTGSTGQPTSAPITKPPGSLSPVVNATGSTDSPTANIRDRKLRRRSVKDVITDNAIQGDGGKERILLDPENFRPADRSDEEWAEWIEAYSANARGEASEGQRKLLEGDYLSFHNYQFLIDVRTEYYFRYSGTSTVPPCYGPFTAGTRGNTNHWRVLKDPIRVHPRQISEMERLLRERVAPKNDNSAACENDTAGKVDSKGHISVARPLMQFHYTHFMTFCECEDWGSKWPEDRAWCALQKGDQLTRLYDHPYNFESGESFQK